MNSKTKKVFAISATSVVVVIVAALLGAGVYMTNYALKPQMKPYDELSELRRVESRYKSEGLAAWGTELMESGRMKDTVMTVNGCSMHAYYATADSTGIPSGKTAVLVHGYTSNPMVMMPYARMYMKEFGYDVLLPALRYHAGSGGKAIQMGWFDRLDVLEWSKWGHEHFSDSLQVVHGVSMGAATTMMLSGEDTPSYIKGFVEDCGYTSAWDEFAGEARKKFNLPTFPVLNFSSLVCRIRFGWGFKEASSLRQLAKCSKPMLFIHGDSDDFVPTEMVYRNYDAKTSGFKDIWIAEGTGHAESYSDHTEEYTAKVRGFLSSRIDPGLN